MEVKDFESWSFFQTLGAEMGKTMNGKALEVAKDLWRRMEPAEREQAQQKFYAAAEQALAVRGK